jgi:putative hemolysin
MIFYIGLFLFLLAVTAFFNVAELALVATRIERIHPGLGVSKQTADRVLALKREPGRFLATTQSGITLASILAGTFCVVAFEHGLEEVLATIDSARLSRYAQPVASVLAIVITSYLTLIVGELLPKRIALTAPERLAVFVVPLIRLSMPLFSPFIWALQRSTDALLRALDVPQIRDTKTTEEEIRYVIARGLQSGVLPSAEHEMMESILELSSRSVRSIMTSRRDLEWVDEAMTEQEIKDRTANSPYSKIIITRNRDLDNPVGVVAKKDFLRQYLTNGSLDFSPLVKPPLFVPDTASILNVLTKIKRVSAQMLFVVDEFGTLVGIVTLTDILEAVAGGVAEPERDGHGNQRLVPQPDGSFLVSGSMPADDLVEYLSLRDTEIPQYKTVAGLILTKLQALPQVGDSVVIDDWTLEITQMDSKRIQTVRLVPSSSREQASSEENEDENDDAS